jgi:hypothetical protein
MKKIAGAALISVLISLPAFATTDYKSNNMVPAWLTSRVYMGAYGGYGTIDGAYENDGDFTQGRLSLGLNAYQYQRAMFGAEIAVQSGNSMRLQVSPAVLAALGGLPVQVTLKPFVDLLVTVKGQITDRFPLIAFLKGGIAYRQMQLNDRISSKDYLSQVNGELQAGLGYKLTEYATLTAFYQGIYSKSSAGVSVDPTGEFTYINQIPTQQAGFVGIEYTI